MIYYDDSFCVSVPPEYLARNLMFFFDHNFENVINITLYGKHLVCDKWSCDHPPSVLLLEDDICGENRKAFCSHPKKCAFVEYDSASANGDDDVKGCLFTLKCTPSKKCSRRFAFMLHQPAVEPGKMLKICGIKLEPIAPITEIGQEVPQGNYMQAMSILWSAMHCFRHIYLWKWLYCDQKSFSDVVWAPRRLKSLLTWPFVVRLDKVNKKESTETSHDWWPLDSRHKWSVLWNVCTPPWKT